jgi:site-specific DNA-methyltransferase (adenine-specific)
VYGECLDVLRAFPDCSIDSVVTDVPYGLGDDPTPEELVAYILGADLKTGEFMNKDWEIPSVPTWKEVFRVLKPGAFVFTFAGCRTQDIIALGLRAAGFESRDCIDVEMGPPILRWIRAQGMPKSVDVGKEFRKAGEESLATLFCGHGTALKTYWEPILIFRKPILEKTLLAQVKATGTGILNIDASRVKHSSPEDFAKHKAGVDAIKKRGGKMEGSWKNSSDLSGANDVSLEGRYPSNVLFVHSDLCRKKGTTTSPMQPINRFDDGAKPFGGGAGHSYTTHEREDEVITIWDCHPSCPVYHLGKQHKDAPKFFYGFDPEANFFYVPKPSKKDKSEGLPEDEQNLHVSVKSVKLMQYLVKMATPKGGVVLDLYCGSGSTCVAAANEGFDFIGIEREEPSVITARARVAKALEERASRTPSQDLLDSLELE